MSRKHRPAQPDTLARTRASKKHSLEASLDLVVDFARGARRGAAVELGASDRGADRIHVRVGVPDVHAA
jgi:hypothetical protein